MLPQGPFVRYNTRPATRFEYAPLLRELRGIYERGDEPVKLRVVRKRTRKHDKLRRAELERALP